MPPEEAPAQAWRGCHKLAEAILDPLSEEKETDTTRDPPRRVSAYYKAMDEGPEALLEYHRKHGRKTEGD